MFIPTVTGMWDDSLKVKIFAADVALQSVRPQILVIDEVAAWDSLGIAHRFRPR